MSGTSLDGVDFCLCEFKKTDNQWKYSILKAETQSYSTYWKKRLLEAEKCSGETLMQIDTEYGGFLGLQAKNFLQANKSSADFISSHGHTIFHQVDKQFTFQLGKGSSIAASSNLLTISDFRTLDVASGGQGAPLVPFGDKALFGNYDCCVNLGGISNLSYDIEGARVAYDVAPTNMVINYLVKKGYGKEFDNKGEISRSGNLNEALFNQLNQLDFYTTEGPKSLGKEWVFKFVIPVIDSYKIPLKDKLYTFTKHSAFQLARTLKSINITSNILITGGGTRNDFYMTNLKDHQIEYTIPSVELVDFKEALIFAFLGLKRFLGEINTLKSVTGASKDSCGGSISFC